MTRERIREDAKTAACLFGGFFGAILSQTAYVASWGLHTPGLQLLVGVQAPGGAPYVIHLFNAMVWGIWAAAGFSIVTKLVYGYVSIRRIALLYLAGEIFIATGGWLVDTGTLSFNAHTNTILLIYLLAGFLVVRDWAAGPRNKMALAELPNGSST
ncbi:hypothetical protein [Aminobacter ciceronei]|uniref:DUF4383 domain-containing protein n=1 Tax=Aminobacter ciceronei TaxID=150723 RepID=A0ABR6CHR5_9HYPH|nr:hypothetical protein [Aminobacter ciceronei]MBA8910507.1 hypothetical protein [Aminobacter ciceronei]MBA9024261.1 hypothetical protein [Aminobacter ciceronei]